MYKQSRLTGKIYINDVEVIPDDRIAQWNEYAQWVREGNTAALFDGTESEIKDREKNIEFQIYLKRKKDGEQAYLKISAEFRLAKLNGVISEETHRFIENILKPVRNEVMFGQWKEALFILEEIGNSQIGNELYNRLHLQISNYINENY